MVKLTRVFRDYREAGAINGLLALWGFVDGPIFLTKAGHVGLVYRVQGIDLGVSGKVTYLLMCPGCGSRPIVAGSS